MSIEPEDEFEVELEGPDFEVEVEDDTPLEDRGREPLPKELVEELEADELDDYSDKVKTRLKQMKKVWHDERREKERALREQQEAVTVAQRMLEENRRLKQSLFKGEENIVASHKQQAEMGLAEARREYKEAYEAGDTDRVLEAQEKLQNAQFTLRRIAEYQPPLQEEESNVRQVYQEPTAPRIDRRTSAWQERNTWYGTDEEMTALALGLHQKLIKQHGENFVHADEYWQTIDKTMARRFPEYFGDNRSAGDPAKPVSRGGSRPATVVAPASRSTSSKKIKLSHTQVSIAKRLGLTQEQYAREYAKQER